MYPCSYNVMSVCIKSHCFKPMYTVEWWICFEYVFVTDLLYSWLWTRHINAMRVICEFQKVLYVVFVPEEVGGKCFFKKWNYENYFSSTNSKFVLFTYDHIVIIIKTGEKEGDLSTFLLLKVISETGLKANVLTCMFKTWKTFCIWNLQQLCQTAINLFWDMAIPD